MKCSQCDAPLPPGKCYCTGCRSWTIGGGIEVSDTVLLSDAEELPVERLLTKFCDEVFGGGIVRPTVNLIGGSPGAGKSTACVQLTDMLVTALDASTEVKDNGRNVYYAMVEQSNSEIKGLAKRLELKHMNRIQLPKSPEHARALLGGTLGESFRRKPPGAFILDSISDLCGDDLKAAVDVCVRLKAAAVEFNMPCFIISHITKDGDMAGLLKMQHKVDSLSTLEAIDQTMREWKTWKNRWGSTAKSYYYEMTPRGIVYDEEYTKAMHEYGTIAKALKGKKREEREEAEAD